MRVIAGSARSLPLKTVPGLSTRPTTDRIKETLFNILHPGIPGCRFLDLYAGSGAIGIEALSRGAACAVFVEKNPAAVRCIEENLVFTKLRDRAEVIRTDTVLALANLESRNTEPFDIVFLDPPYGTGEVERILLRLSESRLITERSLIVAEESIHFDPETLSAFPFEITRDKRYKTNRHLFLQRKKTL